MINLFRKKNLLKSIDIQFLNSVVSSLPEKYSYLKDQVKNHCCPTKVGLLLSVTQYH
jgi:hypothetical protein